MYLKTTFFFIATTASLIAGAQSATPAAGGQPIAVAGAVQAALRHDPEIRQASERASERRGVLEEESGLFDDRLMFDTLFTFDSQELIGARLEAERNRRLRLEIFSSALDTVAAGIIEGIEGGTSLLFQTACTPDQDRIVITSPDGQRIIVCRNFQGDIVDLILLEAGRLPQSLQDLLELFNDAMREDVRQDIEGAFLDQLRNIARILRLTASSLRLQRQRLGATPDEIQFLELDVMLAHQARFRSGVSLTSSLSLNSTEENYADKPLDPAFGDSTFPNTFTSVAGLQLNLPLGKGQGAVASAAPERAAEASLKAAEALLLHTAAQRALATVTTYWRLAAAQQRLLWLQRSQQTQEGIRDLTRQLVEADELTRSELARVEARFAEVLAEVAAARQEVAVTRLELVTEMGVEAGLLEHAPVAGEQLPDAFRDLARSEVWVQEAYAQRYDLLAAAETRRASEILARAARVNRRHQVDLSFNVSYNTLYETFDERFYEPGGFLSAWEGKIAGPSYGVGLRWVVPFGNHTATGRQVQAEATLAQNAIVEADLKRSIRLRILEAHGTLERARSELAHLRVTLTHQEKALKASRELYQAGEQTLIDTLLTEEQLTAAGLAVVDAAGRIAELEAQLQFESGQLLAGPEEGGAADPTRLQLALLTPAGTGASGTSRLSPSGGSSHLSGGTESTDRGR